MHIRQAEEEKPKKEKRTAFYMVFFIKRKIILSNFLLISKYILYLSIYYYIQMWGIYMIFEFTLKVKLTGVAVIVLELSSYVKFTVEKKMGGGGVSLLYDTFCS
jgi:hypothetical protein